MLFAAFIGNFTTAIASYDKSNAIYRDSISTLRHFFKMRPHLSAGTRRRAFRYHQAYFRQTIEGVPVFDTVAEAKAATGATTRRRRCVACRRLRLAAPRSEPARRACAMRRGSVWQPRARARAAPESWICESRAPHRTLPRLWEHRPAACRQLEADCAWRRWSRPCVSVDLGVRRLTLTTPKE